MLWLCEITWHHKAVWASEKYLYEVLNLFYWELSQSHHSWCVKEGIKLANKSRFFSNFAVVSLEALWLFFYSSWRLCFSLTLCDPQNILFSMPNDTDKKGRGKRKWENEGAHECLAWSLCAKDTHYQSLPSYTLVYCLLFSPQVSILRKPGLFPIM